MTTITKKKRLTNWIVDKQESNNNKSKGWLKVVLITTRWCQWVKYDGMNSDNEMMATIKTQ